MTVSTVFTIFWLTPTSVAEFKWFLAGMLGIFLFAGVGNASTFKQIPMIFDRRQAGGVIGWTGAVAAFGPFLFGVALASIAPTQFFIGLAVFFAGCIWLAWHYYARPGAECPS
jgi:NNP family nitrate/nitrite transporter-like MFS transporter